MGQPTKLQLVNLSIDYMIIWENSDFTPMKTASLNSGGRGSERVKVEFPFRSSEGEKAF